MPNFQTALGLTHAQKAADYLNGLQAQEAQS